MQYIISTPGVSRTRKRPRTDEARSASRKPSSRDGNRIIEADCLYGDASTSIITSFLRRNQSEKGEL